MLRRILAGMVCGVIAGESVASEPPLTQSPTPDALSLDTLDAWVNLLRLDEQELCFLDIAWRDTFAQGVEEAYRVRKPVLLWAMNGHPLGCT